MLYALCLSALVAATYALPANTATQSAYGQCGGIGWTGPTSCVSGYYCKSNGDYYSQCIPGSPSTSAAQSTSKPATTTPRSSSATPTSTKASSTTKATTPVTSTKASSSTKATTAPPSSSTAAGGYGNPFSGKQQYANPYYSSEVINIAIPSLPASLAPAASAVAKTPSFFWMDTLSKVPIMSDILDDIQAANAAGASPQNVGIFVVYDLPDRDCAALASNGEYSIANNGVANYKNYIDNIVTAVKAHSSVPIVFVVEPDSLANLVTNLNVQKCANAKSAYLECVNYAITKLNLPNVSMYLDAGHAGWLGWSANLQPAADLFAGVYKNASSPASVRGLATNVANYNAWDISSAPSYTQGDSNYDEKLYVNALAPLLKNEGFNAHFITDTGRSGVQPTQQQAWGDWCNVKGTGFGLRPSSNTGDSLLDAFVWVKPGGECDGTSNSSSPRYDSHCGLSDALQPAPEAGTWFQAYFQQLLVNANPSFT